MWDSVCQWIAWMIPNRIVYHAFFKVAVHGTVGKYGHQIVSELTCLDAAKRFEADYLANSQRANRLQDV